MITAELRPNNRAFTYQLERSALFHLTLSTGQELVLQGLHRWLRRPCEGEQQAAARQRRGSLKSLLLLLLKTAATGVLVKVLDAAIDYRR